MNRYRNIILAGLGLLTVLALRQMLITEPGALPRVFGNPAANAREPIHLTDQKDRVAFRNFAFRDEDGHLRHLNDSVGQRPVLLHFWATWCAPCLPELPELDALAQREGQRLTVLPIPLDGDAIAAARAFYNERRLKTLPILAPADDAPIPQALPTSVLIDKNGKTAWSTVGAHPWNGADVDTALDALN